MTDPIHVGLSSPGVRQVSPTASHRQGRRVGSFILHRVVLSGQDNPSSHVPRAQPSFSLLLGRLHIRLTPQWFPI